MRKLVSRMACTGMALAVGLAASTGASIAQEKSVVFVPGNFGHPFYNLLSRGVEDAAKELGWSFATQGSSTFTAAAQTPIVNAICAQNPDVLIISPTDPIAMRGPIKRCMDAGIAVVLVDTTLQDTAGAVSAITSDNPGGGKLAAEFIGKALGGEGIVSVQSGQANIITQAQRAEGAMEEFQASYPDIELLELVYTQNSESQSETATRATLTGTPEVSAFFNTAANCTGPNNAIERNSDEGDRPLLVCYDSSDAVTALLKAGRISAVVLQPAYQEGQKAVEFADMYLRGETDGIEESVVLEPILVTAEQANDPEVQDLFY